MTNPHQFSLESMMAEEGMFVSAGLPEGLRRQLDAGRKLEEQAGTVRAKVDRILSEIAAHESEIAKLHEELRRVLNEFPAKIATAANPAA